MKKLIFLVIALTVISASMACAWTSNKCLLNPVGDAVGCYSVDVEATQTGNIWHWVYTMAPQADAKGYMPSNVGMFTLHLGDAYSHVVIEGTSVIGTDLTGWSGNKYSPDSIIWIGDPDVWAAGQPGMFWFDSTWGPSTTDNAYAQGGEQYRGTVPTPVVPEPMSLILGIMGLGSVAGIKSLRRK